MAVEAHTVCIDIQDELSVFDESPQLTHRSRSRDTLGSANLEVFEERRQDLTPSPGIRQEVSPRSASTSDAYSPARPNGVAVAVGTGNAVNGEQEEYS